MTADGVLLKDGVVPKTAYPDALLLDGSRPMTGKFQGKDAKFSLPHSTFEIREKLFSENYYPEMYPTCSLGFRYMFLTGGIIAWDPDYNFPGITFYKSDEGVIQSDYWGTLVYNYPTYGGLYFATSIGNIILDPYGIVKLQKDIEIASGKKFVSDVVVADDKFIELGNAAAGLPAAAAAHRGKLGFVEGAAGARDRVYQCMKSDADAYNWIEIANGGA